MRNKADAEFVINVSINYMAPGAPSTGRLFVEENGKLRFKRKEDLPSVN